MAKNHYFLKQEKPYHCIKYIVIWLLVKQTVTNHPDKIGIKASLLYPCGCDLLTRVQNFVISIFREVDAIFKKLTQNFFQSQY